MSTATCPREDELLDALGRGFVGAELSAHVRECASCSELHLIAGGLLEVRNDAVTHASIPTSGTMLWRMHMRRRHDAQAATRRALFAGQALTLLVAIALTLSIFGADLLEGARAARETIASVHVSTPLLLIIASSLLLAPIAGWVAARGK